MGRGLPRRRAAEPGRHRHCPRGAGPATGIPTAGSDVGDPLGRDHGIPAGRDIREHGTAVILLIDDIDDIIDDDVADDHEDDQHATAEYDDDVTADDHDDVTHEYDHDDATAECDDLHDDESDLHYIEHDDELDDVGHDVEHGIELRDDYDKAGNIRRDDVVALTRKAGGPGPGPS